MTRYPVTARIEVRWRDIDALGHVNNAVYFTYLEVARGRYFDQVFRRNEFPGITCLLVAVSCDYLCPIHQGDVVEVGIRIPAVGETSFDFEYETRTVKETRVVARARSTQVLYDRIAGWKIPITQDRLAAITDVQGKQPPRIKRVT